jgi:hypothetical protein
MKPGATRCTNTCQRGRNENGGQDEDGLTSCSDKSPGSQALGLLPLPPVNDDLGPLSAEDAGSKSLLSDRLAVVIGQVQVERGAGVVVPDLGDVDAVPDGLADVAFNEVVDGSAGRAVGVASGGGVTERLYKVAFLNVGDELEFLNDLGSSEFGVVKGQGLVAAGAVLESQGTGRPSQEDGRGRDQGGKFEEHGDD